MAAPNSVFTRRVEDFVEFWCGNGDSSPLSSCQSDAIESQARRRVVESFPDVETLDAYLSEYAHWNIVSAVWKDGTPVKAALLEDMPSLLAFPSRMGMDPSDPETIAWAKFFVPYYSGGTYAYHERATWKDVAKLRKAGVPLEYARALDTPTWETRMPVRRIIAMHRAGITTEYASTLLYGNDT